MIISFIEESKTVTTDWSVLHDGEEYSGSVTFHDDYSRMEPTFSWHDDPPEDGRVSEHIESEITRVFYKRRNDEA